MTELSEFQVCLAVSGSRSSVALLGRRLGEWQVVARLVALRQDGTFRSALTLCNHCRGLAFDLWADLPGTIEEALLDLEARKLRDFPLAIIVASGEAVGEQIRRWGEDPPELEPGTLVFFNIDQGQCELIWPPEAHDRPHWLARKLSDQPTEVRS